MIRRLITGIFALGLLIVATPAFAQSPPTTETTTEHGVTETFVDVVPTCQDGGPAYEITLTYNGVEHSTLFADGREHDTFTQTGRFVATPVDDPALDAESLRPRCRPCARHRARGSRIVEHDLCG